MTKELEDIFENPYGPQTHRAPKPAEQQKKEIPKTPKS